MQQNKMMAHLKCHISWRCKSSI